MKSILLTAFLAFSSFLYSQGCYIEVTPLHYGTCTGSTLNLSANIYTTTTPVQFTGDTLPFNWVDGPFYMFPDSVAIGPNCTPHPNGYSSARFRGLTTDTFQIDCTGAKLHFDLATGNEDIVNNPNCDAVDMATEGLYIDFSIDNGNTYHPFKYIRPDGVIFDNDLTQSFFPNYNGWLHFENWRNVTIDLPDSLANETVKFQLSQRDAQCLI